MSTRYVSHRQAMTSTLLLLVALLSLTYVKFAEAATQTVSSINGAAYGGRYVSYVPPTELAAEASFAKSYSVALHSWSYMGLYIGLALIGSVLIVIFYLVAMAQGLTAHQVITIVLSTGLAFVLLLLLLGVFSSFAIGASTPRAAPVYP
jgi:hypothetical protein